MPCTAHAGPTRRRASSNGTRQSTPTTEGPADAISASSSPVPTPKRMVGTSRSATPSSTARVAGSAKRAYSSGESDPAQLSNSCTACAPASTCERSEATAMAASRSVSCAHSAGSVCMSAFTLVKVRDGPPSTRYDATVNGAPAKPINATPVPASSRRTAATASATYGASSAGANGRNRDRSAAPRKGDATTGPTSGFDLDAEADGVHRHDNVGEENRRVHAVAVHGLQGQLRGQRGVGDGGQNGAVSPRRAVLGQRAPGLAHEPHRRARHGLAPAGAHQVGTGVVGASARLEAHAVGSMTTAVP